MLWVEVLNRGLDAEGLGSMPSRRDGGDRAVAAQLARDLGLLRAAASSLTLGLSLPEPRALDLEHWLGEVTLHAAAGERWNGFHLPAVRARRRASRLPDETEALLSTALVELLSLGPGVTAVSRCHGLVRPGAAPGPWGPEDDARAAEQAGLLEFVRSGWQQCPRLVVAPRQARYCSKACSNAAFAARKGARHPGYFASKQALYRVRQRRRAAARVVDSAALFVD